MVKRWKKIGFISGDGGSHKITPLRDKCKPFVPPPNLVETAGVTNYPHLALSGYLLYLYSFLFLNKL